MNAIIEYEGKDVIFCDVDPADWIESELLAGRWFELVNLEIIRSFQVRGNYVDVGAYIGTHSLFFSLFCPVEKVYSIEPQLDIYPKLVQNLKINGITNRQTYNVALSDEPGRGLLRQADKTKACNRGSSQLLPGNEVDVVTLDSLGLQNVTLMKIDVEGFELHVLRGAKETLKSVEHLFVEIWDEAQHVSVVQLLEPYNLQLQEKLPMDNLYHFSR